MEITSHWPISLGLVGLYLILVTVVKITENLVECDALLDDRVVAIGHGLAYSYYYGFLKIILPAGETCKSIYHLHVYLTTTVHSLVHLF